MKEDKRIWLSSPHMGGREREIVEDVFAMNWIAPVGPHIAQFEKKLSSLSSNFNIAALNSGTSAIHLALILSGVAKGDNVICSSFTFSASANPIEYIGANPIFIDADDYYNIDSEKVIEFIKSETVFKNGFTYNKKAPANARAIIS